MSSAASIAVTNPQRIQIENHRRDLRSIWNSPEWKTESKAYKARHPAKCSRCGKEGPIVPGHRQEDYDDMPSYIQKVREDRAIPLCPRCNLQESKGRRPCPSCIEKHAADPSHYIHYIGQGEESCFNCRNPEVRKRKKESHHACLRRAGTQQCYRDGRVYICTRSSKTAPGCDYFQKRAVAA